MDAVCELLRLLEVRKLALHPNGISVWRICDSSVDGTLATALESVVSLTGSWAIPIPRDVSTSDTLGEGSGLGVALSLGLLQELDNQLLLVGGRAGIDNVDNSIVEAFQASLGIPLVLDRLELGTVLASLLSSDHEIVERLEIGVGRTDDIGMVTGVNGRSNEGSGFGVGSGDRKEVGSFNAFSLSPRKSLFKTHP